MKTSFFNILQHPYRSAKYSFLQLSLSSSSKSTALMVAKQEYSTRQITLLSGRSLAIGRSHDGLQNQGTAKEARSFPSLLTLVVLWPVYYLCSDLPVELAHPSVPTAATTAAVGFACATAASKGYIFSPTRQNLQQQ